MGRRRRKKNVNIKTKKDVTQDEVNMEDKHDMEGDAASKKNDDELDLANEPAQVQDKVDIPLLLEGEPMLPGESGDQEDGVDNIDSESTTSVSTIECPEEDLERSRRLSNTPPKKSRPATPSPSSTNSGQSSQRAGCSRSRPSSVSTTGSSGKQSPSPTSSLPSPTFPVRLGITWKIGSKVEAMDFIQKWYPARIVEMNAAQLEVLIHFEGWNSRYDEWVKMNSDRLRPLARHSVRKETKKKLTKAEYKVGECVFAKWTDCRHYAARILSINPSGSYEVMFYDGFKKTVQPINVKVMPPEVQVEYANAGLLPPHPKAVVRRRKDSKSEVVEKHVRKKSVSDKETSPEDTPKQRPKKEEATKNPKKTPITGVKRRKLFVGGAFSAKRVKMDVQSPKEKEKGTSEGAESMAEAGPSTDDTKPLGTSQSSGPAPDPEPDPPSAPAASTVEEAPAQSGSDEVKEGSLEVKERSLEVKERSEVEVPGSVPGSASGETGSVADTALASEPSPVTLAPTLETDTPLAEGGPPVTTPTEVQPPTAPQQGEAEVTETPSTPSTPSVSQTPGPPQAPQQAPQQPITDIAPLQPPKAFRVEEDHNRYKCPFDGCSKGFRKETLLEYHIKYYHTEDGKPIPPPPPRKRKKTSSICSTDSEISVGGRSSTSKRRKRPSEASLNSLPDAVFDRLALQIEDNVGSELDDAILNVSVTDADPREAQAADDMIALGEEAGIGKKDEEVVNCICQLNEENGLMIQCEVCLCWQHASCMELSEETLPKRYVCYVCTNPPGIRDSARFMYVQDWFREGKLSSFNFLPTPPEAEERAARMFATHGVVGEMHGVDRVLDSLRRKIHILQEKNHPEFHFWTKNWDREIEKKRQEEEAVSKGAATTAMDISHVSENVVVNVDTDDCPEPVLNTQETNIKPPFGETSQDKKDSVLTGPPKQEIKSEPVDPKETDEASGSQGGAGTSEMVKVPPVEEKQETVSVTAPTSGLHDYSMVNKSNLGEGDSRPISLLGLDMEADELESDVSLMAGDEDPSANCEKNLLEHIMNMQDKVASRLDLIEEHVAALEAMEDRPPPPKDTLADMPILKKKIHNLVNDLVRVKRMSRFH